MNEGQRSNSNSRQSRRRSVVLRTPDVLKHRPYKSYERTQSKQPNRSVSRQRSNSYTSTSRPTGNKWYSAGFPALRAADKKVRAIKAKQDARKVNDKVKRRSRSYSRGQSVYFNNDDPTIPYYRSKSVESMRRDNSTFDPVVNEKDVISLTYTGRMSRENTVSCAPIASRRGSVGSRRSSGIVQKRVESVVPHLRHTYDFNDLETRIYQQIQKIYGEPDADSKNKQFFLSLAQMQSDHLQLKRMNMSKSDRMFLERMFQEVTNMKKETGKILRNSTHRYSTPFVYPSPVNDKIRRLPRDNKDEKFLKKMPRTREKLRLKPIRHDVRARDRRNYRTFDQYENYKPRPSAGETNQFQRAKEPENPADMLKFLQQAERLLAEYSKGILYNSENNYYSGPGNPYEQPSTNRYRQLKPILHRQPPSDHHEVKQQYGRISPKKQAHTPKRPHSVEPKPNAPVYKRPQAFYDARKHQQFHSRASLVDHRLYEAKHAKETPTRSEEYSLRGLAT